VADTKHNIVANYIREKIRSGEWKPGDKIPTIAQFGKGEDAAGNPIPKTAWGTLRGALITVRTEGWIAGQQGEGNFVTQTPPESPYNKTSAEWAELIAASRQRKK